VAAIFLVGLGLVIRYKGGDAFSPGPVTAMSRSGITLNNFRSHAEFETNCNLCHQPLQKSQTELCVACHENVGSQLATHTGAHGHLENAPRCAECHAEHKGRDFNPIRTALENFDHSKSGFPLDGKHAQAACTDCHKNDRYDQAKPECSSCHAEPEVHKGMFGLDCATCHSAEAWKPAKMKGSFFNHETVGFSLAKHGKDYQGKPLLCVACHTGSGAATPFDQQVCAACHAAKDSVFMAKHTGQFGINCAQCHDGTDRMHGFKHEQVFVLDGKHAAAACETCHAGQKFRGTPGECSACHKEPEIHAGNFGLKCQYCHTAQAWQPALLITHNFPLDHGGKGETPCQTCHAGAYTQNDCFACHDHQREAIAQSHTKLKLSESKLADCVACHLDGQVHKDLSQ
jgi:hypothetical protein